MRGAATALAVGLGWVCLTPAQAQQQFNGRWSVEVVTEQGACDRAYRYPVAIENGRIRYAGSEGFNVVGTVTARGAIRSTIAAGQSRAEVTGRLAGRAGSGTWAISGTRSCSGFWRAEREG